MTKTSKNTKTTTSRKKTAVKGKHTAKHIKSQKETSKKTINKSTNTTKNNTSNKSTKPKRTTKASTTKKQVNNKANKTSTNKTNSASTKEKKQTSAKSNTPSINKEKSTIENKPKETKDKLASEEKNNEENLSSVEAGKKAIEEQKKIHAEQAIKHNKNKRAAALRKEEYQKARNKKIGIVVGCILAVYLLGILVFSTINYPRTTIADTDLSFYTEEATKNALQQESTDYSLNIDGLGVEETITGSQINYSFNTKDVVNNIKKYKNPLTWPIDIWLVHDYKDNYVVEFDQSTATSLSLNIINKHNQTATSPTNAGFNVDIQNKTATIKDEVLGNLLDTDRCVHSILSRIGSARKQLTLSENEQILPTIFSTDARMEKALDKANQMVKTTLPLTMGQATVSTFDTKATSTMICVDAEYNACLDQEKLVPWVANLATTCDTVGKTRNFTTPYGKTCSVAGGDIGWEINQPELVNQINQNITLATNKTIVVPCNQSLNGYAGAGQRDWGLRYIDVDLSTQHAYMYDDAGNLVWQSEIVTGKPGQDTPTGVYRITGKQSPSVLRGGPGPDGSPAYVSEVAYWMPFVGNSIGLHDATWQSSFGGDRWINNGSHGCVNLPLDLAGALYNLCNTGDIVVVHN